MSPEVAWRRLLDAVREETRVATPPVDEARLELLRSVGMPPEVEALLAIGYPERPVRVGDLLLFPPRESLGTTGRWPRAFFVSEAGADLAHLVEDDPATDAELMDAAAALLRASRGRPVFGEEPGRSGPVRFWRPAVERRLQARLGEPRARRVLALMGRAHRADDYRAELERRLHWARLWLLIGVLAVIWAMTRDGRLSERLVLAGVAFATVGLGLGLSPWLRENARLRALDADAFSDEETAPEEPRPPNVA